MKTFSQFINEVVEPAQQAWQTWLNSPAGKASAFKSSEELDKAAREFMRTYQSTGKPPGWASGGAGTPPPPPQKPPAPAPKPSGLAGKVGRGAMGALNVGVAGYDIYTGTKERQAKGEPLATALPKETGKAGSGLLASTAAATAASRVLPKNPWINVPGSIAAGIAGYAAGETAASSVIKKIEDPFGGKARMAKIDQTRSAQWNQARQRQAMQTSRQQASKAGVYGATKGSGIVGTGRPTTFNTASNTITTGGKTVQLPKTQILPGGRVGDLAYRGGKATYLARASVASRDTNVLSRLSRATGIGGQRERDIAATNRERQQAMQNTLRYRQQLGITGTGVSKPPKK
jgi:hypothetical protein